MTAKFISEKCGYLTIRVNNNQMPLMPLFAPVYSSTRPYSQTRSNTQRALMQPDEVLRLPMDEAIVFIRGQQPLKLFKVIPDEHPDFKRLRAVSISEYTPLWRNSEDIPDYNLETTQDTEEITPVPPQQKEKPTVGADVTFPRPEAEIALPDKRYSYEGTTLESADISDI